MPVQLCWCPCCALPRLVPALWQWDQGEDLSMWWMRWDTPEDCGGCGGSGAPPGFTANSIGALQCGKRAIRSCPAAPCCPSNTVRGHQSRWRKFPWQVETAVAWQLVLGAGTKVGGVEGRVGALTEHQFSYLVLLDCNINFILSFPTQIWVRATFWWASYYLCFEKCFIIGFYAFSKFFLKIFLACPYYGYYI